MPIRINDLKIWVFGISTAFLIAEKTLHFLFAKNDYLRSLVQDLEFSLPSLKTC